jgi:hypothetical protein
VTVKSAAVKAIGVFKLLLYAAFAGCVYGGVTCILDEKRGKQNLVSNSMLAGIVAGLVVGAKCEYRFH